MATHTSVQRLPTPPHPACCLPNYSGNLDPFPSSRWHKQLAGVFKSNIKKMLMRPNVEQRQARTGLRTLLRTRDLTVRFSSAQEIEQTAALLDNLLFQGMLMSRCTFILETSSAMPTNRVGESRLTPGCPIHQQFPNAVIAINHNAVYPVSSGPQFIDQLSTLLHELVHVYIYVYVDRRRLLPDEAMSYYGLHGHGYLFFEIFTAAATYLRRYQYWEIDMEVAMYSSVREDQRVQAELWQDWNRISSTLPWPVTAYTEIARHLGFDNAAAADTVRQLIDEGRDAFEIMLIVRYPWSKMNWRYPNRYP